MKRPRQGMRGSADEGDDGKAAVPEPTYKPAVPRRHSGYAVAFRAWEMDAFLLRRPWNAFERLEDLGDALLMQSRLTAAFGEFYQFCVVSDPGDSSRERAMMAETMTRQAGVIVGRAVASPERILQNVQIIERALAETNAASPERAQVAEIIERAVDEIFERKRIFALPSRLSDDEDLAEARSSTDLWAP